MVTLMTLDLYHYDEGLLREQFEKLLAQSPRFFENTPVVVSLEHLTNPKEYVDLLELKSLCASFGINLIAVRGGANRHRYSAHEAKLAWLTTPTSGTSKRPPSEARRSVASFSSDSADLAETDEESAEQDTLNRAENTVERRPEQPAHRENTRIITGPVRTGQQIYHNGDLILTGPVNTGAEILAAGNIHAYGPFRGRALAGVNGDASARIYAMHFEAELVSIHGHYKMSVNMDKDLWKQAVQVYMDQDQLIISLI